MGSARYDPSDQLQSTDDRWGESLTYSDRHPIAKHLTIDERQARKESWKMDDLREEQGYVTF